MFLRNRTVVHSPQPETQTCLICPRIIWGDTGLPGLSAERGRKKKTLLPLKEDVEVSKTRAPLLRVPTVRIKAFWVGQGGLQFVLKQIGISSLQEAIQHKQVRFGGAQTQVLKMNVCLPNSAIRTSHVAVFMFLSSMTCDIAVFIRCLFRKPGATVSALPCHPSSIASRALGLPPRNCFKLASLCSMSPKLMNEGMIRTWNFTHFLGDDIGACKGIIHNTSLSAKML